MIIFSNFHFFLGGISSHRFFPSPHSLFTQRHQCAQLLFLIVENWRLNTYSLYLSAYRENIDVGNTGTSDSSKVHQTTTGSPFNNSSGHVYRVSLEESQCSNAPRVHYPCSGGHSDGVSRDLGGWGATDSSTLCHKADYLWWWWYILSPRGHKTDTHTERHCLEESVTGTLTTILNITNTTTTTLAPYDGPSQFDWYKKLAKYS